MGDFNAKVGVQTNTSDRATGCFRLGQRNKRLRGDTGRMGNIILKKIMNTQFQQKATGDGQGEAAMEILKMKQPTS